MRNPSLAELKNTNTVEDLANTFGLPYSKIAYLLYGQLAANQYTVFTIPKKRGGERRVVAPHGLLKGLQRSLLPALVEGYKPTFPANGFIKGRSILRNADPHIRKNIVVNVDLEDFFPTITFYRVRGLFLKKPFLLNWPVATVLAQIVCFQGKLAQGAPTSPTISNFICARLDRLLLKEIDISKGSYTRYCDDLTFSFNVKPERLNARVGSWKEGTFMLGARLREVIEGEGFRINEAKLRCSYGSRATKKVTGIVVNEKRNLERPWIRRLEACLYASEKFGIENAALRHYSLQESTPGLADQFLRKIKGQISYLGMVRTKHDYIVAEFSKRFNELPGNTLAPLSAVEVISVKRRIPKGLWAVVSSNEVGIDNPEAQGTAFMLKGRGLVTAAHVVANNTKIYPYVYVFRSYSAGETVVCEVTHIDHRLDIAILKPMLQTQEKMFFSVFEAQTTDAEYGQSVIACGFPDYGPGHSYSIANSHITSTYVASDAQYLDIEGNIKGGISGGPLLSKDLNAIGVILRGVAEGANHNEVLTIKELLNSSKLKTN
jgi:S1-C subfamily serine protease